MYIVFLADGLEEIEAVTTVDILRRGNVNVNTYSITGSLTVKGAHDIELKADGLIEDLEYSNIDGVILPGGMPGTLHLGKCDKVVQFMKNCESDGKLVAAICAAPSILADHKLFLGKNVTSYPSFSHVFEEHAYKDEPVVIDGNLITSMGPGTAGKFGFKILDYINGEGFSNNLVDGMIY